MWRTSRVALGMVGLLAVSGCAARTWEPNSQPVGKLTEEQLAPKVTWETEVFAPEASEAFTIRGSAYVTPRVRETQDVLTFEERIFDKQSARYWGQLHVLSGLIFSGLGGLSLAVGEPVGASLLMVGVPEIFVGIGQFLAPVWKPWRRKKERTTSSKVVTKTAVFAEGYEVVGLPLGQSTYTEDRGRFEVVQPRAPLVAVIDLELRNNGVAVGQTKVDLTDTPLWRTQQRAAVRALVHAGDVRGARTRVYDLRLLDDGLEDTYCEAVGEMVTAENRENVAAVFGASDTRPSCVAVWTQMADGWLEESLPKAIAGDVRGVSAAVDAAKPLPERLRAPLVSLARCAEAAAEADLREAWRTLDNIPMSNPKVMECSLAVRDQREEEYIAALDPMERKAYLREARCGTLTLRRDSVANTLINTNYVAAFSKGLARLDAQITQRERSNSFFPSPEKAASIRCMKTARAAGRSLYSVLETEVELGRSWNAGSRFRQAVLDDVEGALGSGRTCRSDVAPVLGTTVRNPLYELLEVEAESREFSCP